jgi:hypothetical protein
VALARIVFALTSLWVLLSRDYAGIAGLPMQFWNGVPASARWRYLDFWGHPLMERGLEWAAGIALVLALVGIVPRIACFVSALLLYHLAPFETILWTPSPYARGLTIPVLALLTLAFSPCGDCWTVVRSNRRQAAIAGDYTWPVRLIQIFLAQVYLFSGWAKVAHSGWAWASGANLRGWLLYFNQEDQVRVFHRLGNWLTERPLLCQAVGIGTLVFELGFVAVLFSRTARRVLVPMAAVFHLGILLSMNLVFLNLPQLLVYVDWERTAIELGRPPSAAT